jgi:ribose transport system substrate-binding protein
LSIGLVALDGTNVSSQREVDAAQKAMEGVGWKVSMQDPQGDQSKANSLCQQFVTRKVDAIIIDVFQGSQMAQCLSTAKGADIPVFFLAGAFDTGMAGAISTAVPAPINDVFVKEAAGKPNLQILALQYSPGSPCLLRQQDMDKKLKAAGVDLKVVQRHEVKIPGQVTDAQAAATAWLNAHPKSSGESLYIWSCFSDAAIGALAALNQADRQVPIYTWDLTKQVVAPLKSGQIKATAISDADKMGGQLIDMIKAVKDGGAPRGEDADALVLDSTNIDDYVAKNTVS